MRLTLQTRILLLFAFGTILLPSQAFHGQSSGGSALVSYGYTLPPSKITAAPGQILMVSVAGSRTRLSGPVSGVVDGGGNFPTQLGGFTISLLQPQQHSNPRRASSASSRPHAPTNSVPRSQASRSRCLQSFGRHQSTQRC